MDSFTLLHQQQQDFCQRLEANKSSLNEDNYLFAELVMIQQATIEEITLESIQETEDIIHEYQFDYPRKQILNTLFYSKLVEVGFCSRYGHLLSLENNSPENIDFHSYTITQHHFSLTNDRNLRVLLKTYHGNVDGIDFKLTAQEFEDNDIFVFAGCPHILEQDEQIFPILFLGFIPKKNITNIDSYQKYLELNVTIKDLFYIGGFSDYLSHIPDIIEGKLSEVNVYLKKGDYQQVIATLNRDKKGKTASDKLYFLEGICYYRLGQKRKAIESFLTVIKLNQDSYLSYHWLGQIYQDLEQYRQALTYYNEEIKICGINFFAYFNRAFVHSKLDNLVQALDDYNVAVKINSNVFQTFYNRGIICHRLGDHYGAIENYLQALKLNPDLASAHYNLAIVYQELSNYKGAIASYQQAIKIKNNYLEAYYNLAILQANIGLYKQSIESYEKILTIDPNFIPAIYNHKSLVLLLKKEGHIFLTENEHSSHIAHAVADIISVKKDDKHNYSSPPPSDNDMSILNNNSSNFLAID